MIIKKIIIVPRESSNESLKAINIEIISMNAEKNYQEWVDADNKCTYEA